MPIAANQIRVAETHILGISAAAGSGARFSNFTFHWRRTTVSNVPAKVPLEAIFQTSIVVPLAAALNVRWLQTGNTVRWIDDAQDPPLAVVRALPGLVAGDSMTSFNAAFLLFRTTLRGKNYRGGKHLFPMSEADTTLATEDIFNAAALARLTTLANAIMAGFTDTNGNIWVPVVLSRKLSPMRTNPTTITTTDITQVSINKRVGRMKHRETRSIY